MTGSDASSGQKGLAEPSFSAASGKDLYRNFVIMCVAFSANHGCINTAMNYAGTDFPETGDTSNAALYGTYCFSAMFLSSVVIASAGPKYGLLAGLLLYTVYVGSFLIALVSSPVVMVVGGALGGFGAGFLWVCQGTYFTETAKLYAAAKNQPLEKVSSMLGSTFAIIYLGSEMTADYLASLIKHFLPGTKGNKVVYGSYTIICAVSVFGMMLAQDVRPAPERGSVKSLSLNMVTQKAAAAANLLMNDLRMVLMVPTQLAFAFVSTFLTAYINSEITAQMIGHANLGLLLGEIAFIAGLTSFISERFITATGLLWPMMCLGAFAFACVVLPFAIEPNPESYEAVWKVVLVYMAQGVGRGVYESTNKAVIASFFPDDAPAAFG
jgi:hypothetical protein